MPVAQIGVILGNFAGMGKKTPCAGTEHNTLVSSRDKQKNKTNKKHEVMAARTENTRQLRSDKLRAGCQQKNTSTSGLGYC